MPEPSDILTPAEAAAFLKVHRRTLIRLAKEGRIPGTLLSKKWRFRRDLLLAWMGGPSPASPAPLPSIQALLAPERMQLRMKAATREAAIQELVALVDAAGLCEDGRELARRVLERENLSSTALPTGAAVLHPGQAAPELVKKPVIAYGRSLDGVAFGAGAPTKLFFLVCAPSEALHVGLVTAVKGLCRDAAFCKEVHLQNAPEGVVRVVEKADYSKARLA